MRYSVSVIAYEADESWMEGALPKTKTLVSNVAVCPEHAADCEYGTYVAHVAKATSTAVLHSVN